MEVQHYKSLVQMNRRKAQQFVFFSSKVVFEAEIRWVIKMIMSHYSFNSCPDISAIFGQMFPESEIAKRFMFRATKSER